MSFLSLGSESNMGSGVNGDGDADAHKFKKRALDVPVTL